MQPTDMPKAIVLCLSRIDLEMDFEKKKKKGISLADAGHNLFETHSRLIRKGSTSQV
jgi:hypothetical protein